MRQRLLAIFQRLYAAHGPQHWWPGDSPFEVVVGAILTQAAAWNNVERAIQNIKKINALSPQALHRLSRDELSRLVYPAGYYNAKASKLKALVEMLYREAGGSLEALLSRPTAELRRLLLSTHGVGPETTDSILLYAAERPVFVVDAYTRRLFSRLGLRPPKDDYASWQSLFMANLPADVALFNEYHALIVRHCKEVCRRQPRCDRCSLREICPTGLGAAPAATASPAAGGHPAMSP